MPILTNNDIFLYETSGAIVKEFIFKVCHILKPCISVNNSSLKLGVTRLNLIRI